MSYLLSTFRQLPDFSNCPKQFSHSADKKEDKVINILGYLSRLSKIAPRFVSIQMVWPRYSSQHNRTGKILSRIRMMPSHERESTSFTLYNSIYRQILCTKSVSEATLLKSSIFSSTHLLAKAASTGPWRTDVALNESGMHAKYFSLLKVYPRDAFTNILERFIHLRTRLWATNHYCISRVEPTQIGNCFPYFMSGLTRGQFGSPHRGTKWPTATPHKWSVRLQPEVYFSPLI